MTTPSSSPGSAFRRDLTRLPNLVSLGRIALIVLGGSLFVAGFHLTGLAIGIPAGLSDHLDGWLARRRGEVTELGSLLDILADLLFQLIAFGIGVAFGVWPLHLLLAWGFRDLTVTVTRASAAQQGFSLPSSTLGKVAINFNYYAFVVMGLDIARPFASPGVTEGLHLLGLAAAHVGVALQWVAGAGYLRSYVRQYRGQVT